MTRRGRIRLVAYTLAAFAVLFGYCLHGYSVARSYRAELKATHEQAFSDLYTAVETMELALRSGNAVESPAALTAISGELSRAAGMATASLGEMPLSGYDLTTLSRYFAQVGEWATELAARRARGESLEAERERAEAVLNGSTALKLALQAVAEEYRAGELTFGGLDRRILCERDLAGLQMDLPDVGERLEEVQQVLADLPELRYDGANGYRVEDLQPLLLSVDAWEGEALALRAAKVLGVNRGALHAPADFRGTVTGVTYQTGDRTLTLTQAGGYVLTYFDGRQPGEPALTAEEALERAAQQLSAMGYEGFTPCSWQRQGDTLTACFDWVGEGYVCRGDCIRITAAMSDGALLSVDASEYLLYHAHRTPDPALSVQDLQGLLAGRSVVGEPTLCYIRSAGGQDVLCYEVLCENGSGSLLVYFDGDTGLERRVLTCTDGEEGRILSQPVA